MKLFMFWASFLWFPFIVISIRLAWRRTGLIRSGAIALLLLSLPFAWARFVEPRLLIVHEETIRLADSGQATRAIRIALVSDMHIGLFSNAVSIERLVRRINRESVDAVFVAGDFTYWLKAADIDSRFSPLAQLDAPVFAVLGNHDVGFPGPLYGQKLYGPLREMGVVFVENRSHVVELNGQALIVAGTSDLWQRAYNFDFSANFEPGLPVLLLTHNPDMALRVPRQINYDLMLAGHTHGGQIRLPVPGLTQAMIPTRYPFDTGLHEIERADRARPDLVYVTPGTGMVGLPMRFRRPPQIDILTLQVAKSG